MVRVNLINPRKLADQHLIAEYNEILMLVGHLKKHGVKFDKIPSEYCLGEGHINFFKNKLKYLKKRHSEIKNEMNRRGFRNEKSLEVSKYGKEIYCDWKPQKKDLEIITKRICEKIRAKPSYYRYKGNYVGEKFLIDLLK